MNLPELTKATPRGHFELKNGFRSIWSKNLTEPTDVGIERQFMNFNELTFVAFYTNMDVTKSVTVTNLVRLVIKTKSCTYA